MIRLLSFAGVLAVGSVALAADKYDLKMNVPVGNVTVFSLTRLSTMKGHTVMDGQIVDKQDDAERFVQEGTEQVVATGDGVPTVAKFIFDDACGTITTTPGQNARQDRAAYAGQTVTLRRLPTDAVSDDLGSEIDADNRRDLHSLLDPDAAEFPDHPVAIGESWDVSDQVRRYQDLGPDDKMRAFCRLDSVTDIGGRQTAKISISAAFVEWIRGYLRLDTEVTGTELVDMQTGIIVRSDVTGTQKMSGRYDSTRPDGSKAKVVVSGEGTLEESQFNGPAGLAATRPAQ
jgi:hypothetical protein